ncbi:hypothetical protein [Geobacillus sp. YF-1]|uniref:hypothetical protein n=1 Tax=Geobacillus sp. YF-1 TaxID=3457480 RepID=UPI000ABBA97B
MRRPIELVIESRTRLYNVIFQFETPCGTVLLFTRSPIDKGQQRFFISFLDGLVENGCHEQISGISPKKKADFARLL